MIFKRKRREDLGLDMTPMIDCVFQLILFLLLTAGAQIPAIGVHLPGAASAREEAPKSAEVTIRPDGSIHVNGEPIAGLEEIGARLDAILDKSTGSTVTIRADGAVPYRRVIEVMDVSRRAGYENVALAVRRIEPAAAGEGAAAPVPEGGEPPAGKDPSPTTTEGE